MLRTFFEIFLLVSFCCTAVIAAGIWIKTQILSCCVKKIAELLPSRARKRIPTKFDYWIAAFKYKSVSETESKIHCLGTLISKRYILTAAKCIKYFSKIVEAILGSTEKGAPPPQAFNISKEDVTVHPNYTFTERIRKNNIALIRLPKDVDDEVSLTQLNFELEKVSVPVVPNARCAEKFRQIANISEKHICAGDATSPDACKIFAGNPLSDEVILDGVIKTVQYGIASITPGGSNDKFKEYPRVYTRISAYIDWILDNIKS